MKISIIVPVYNSEKYLECCVNSVLAQTYQNWELILIDDESTDSSPLICDIYSKNDPRIITVHKKNGGTSAARNTGLESVSGEYTMFMDNDDFWDDPDALSGIVKNLEESKADLLMFSTKQFFENKNEYKYPTQKCKRNRIVFTPKADGLNEIISKGQMHRAVWAKAISTKLIKDNKLFFPTGMRNEDTDFTAKLLLLAETLDWYDNVFYVYRKGTGQAQTDKRSTKKEVLDLLQICTEHFNETNSIKNTDFRKAFCNYLSFPYAVCVAQYHSLSKSDKEIYIYSNLKKMQILLTYDEDPAMKKIKLTYKIFGFKITSILLGIYMRYMN